MQVGKTANFRRADGVADSFEVTPELIKGLLGHAGNRSIPCNFTHDSDDLHARLGLHKNLRIDADGDLASDLFTMPNEYGKLALWTAKTDPSSAAFSAVFSYNPIKDGERKLAVPLSFDSADLVAKGAACEAMLSQINTDTDMTKEEIQALVADGVKAALKDYKPEGYITEAESDKRITAKLEAFKPEKATLSAEDKAAIVADAEAALVAKLGGGPLLLNLKNENDSKDIFTAKLAEYRKTSPNEGTAISRLLRDHPEFTPQREAHLQAEMAKLTNAA